LESLIKYRDYLLRIYRRDQRSIQPILDNIEILIEKNTEQNMAAVYLSKDYRNPNNVNPNADAASRAIRMPVISSEIMNYAHGTKDRDPKFQKYTNQFRHYDEDGRSLGFRFDKLEDSIPKEGLPSDSIFHPDNKNNKDKDNKDKEEEIDGGKKFKKTRKYKKNKSKNKSKKNKSKKKYKKNKSKKNKSKKKYKK
jgi:hypothetical protein